VSPSEHPDEDPLVELRAMWRELEPEDRLEAHADVQPDAATGRVLDWMRSAWTMLEPPAPRAELRQRLRLRLRRRRVPTWVLPLVAAAALLLVLRLSRQEPGDGSPRESLIEAHSTETTFLASADDPATPLHPEFGPDGSVEIVSGSVRLLLVADAPPAEMVDSPEARETR
jgi:hypothetical protein